MNPAPPGKRRATLATLLILQILQILSLAPWLIMAALSVMAFDAPGSEKMWQPWAFVLAMWSYPLWLLAAGAVSWILFARRRHLWAIVVQIPFTLPALAALAWLITIKIMDWKLPA